MALALWNANRCTSCLFFTCQSPGMEEVFFLFSDLCFSQTVSNFPDKLSFHLCVMVFRMYVVSRYPTVLQGCQLHFSGMFLVPSSCSLAHSFLVGRQFLYHHFQQALFSIQNFFPFKADHFHGCSHHWVELNLVEIMSACMSVCFCSCLWIRVHPHIDRTRSCDQEQGSVQTDQWLAYTKPVFLIPFQIMLVLST